MFTMRFDIQVGSWRLGMVEKVSVRRSVEELAAVEGIGPALVEQLREAVTAASGGAP